MAAAHDTLNLGVWGNTSEEGFVPAVGVAGRAPYGRVRAP
jgi:hypothetical protein